MAEVIQIHFDDFFKHRNQFLCASDLGTLLDMNPYKSLENYRYFKDNKLTEPMNFAMKRGHEIEGEIITLTNIYFNNNEFVKNDMSFVDENMKICATPDALSFKNGVIRGLECKCVGSYSKKFQMNQPANLKHYHFSETERDRLICYVFQCIMCIYLMKKCYTFFHVMWFLSCYSKGKLTCIYSFHVNNMENFMLSVERMIEQFRMIMNSSDEKTTSDAQHKIIRELKNLLCEEILEVKKIF